MSYNIRRLYHPRIPGVVFTALTQTAETEAIKSGWRLEDPFPGQTIRTVISSRSSIQYATKAELEDVRALAVTGGNGGALSTDVARAVAGAVVPSGATMDTLEPGLWQVTNIVQARGLSLPSARPGTLTMVYVGRGGAKTAFFHSIEVEGAPAKVFVTSRIGSSWSNWRELGASAEAAAPSAPKTPTPASRSVLRDGLSARKGGRIGTGGRGAVALRFDDGHAEFRDYVLPLLTERHLPFTRVTTSDRIHTAPVADTEWASMESECLRWGGEVWNHGRTHGDMTEETMYDEIIGARDTLRARMPKLPIDCFAPPGGNVTYAGHMPSRTAAAWDTAAGQLVWAGHALTTGYLTDSYYWPLDGQGRDGQNHYSVDAYNLVRVRQLVNRARDWRTGVVLMWHPNNLGGGNQMTKNDFVATLDYIVEQREAGNILALTVSGLAFADKTSEHRDDVLLTHQGPSRFSERVTFPQYRREIPGSTRELVATVTGTSGTEVTATVGDQSKTHTIPASGTLKIRDLVTIPTDVTALTVEISAPSSDVHLWAI